jgi:hypothetical protein
MTSAAVRIGVGARLVHDGELVEIVEIHTGQGSMDVVLKGTSKQTFIRARLDEPGEPRPEYRSDVPLSRRYASKAAELGAGLRSINVGFSIS